MLSRLVSSAIKKLADIPTGNHQSSDPSEAQYPTLWFPPPPPAGPGTRRLCARCLTLLRHVVFAYGDGIACEKLEMPHSPTMSMLSGPWCVICAKMLLLFQGMQKHVSFEETLRMSPLSEWRLTWKFDSPETVSWHHFSKQAAHVSLMVKHKNGYSWGIGSFVLHPDSRVPLPVAERKSLPDGHGTILSLDGGEPAFSSTLSRESLAMVASWMQECYATHKKCHRLFGKDGSDKPWFPDRLLRITRTDGSGPAWLSTRLVLKSDPDDFPASATTEAVQYLSFSHCWGPEPKEGRGASVLTKHTIDTWRKELPLQQMPLAFQHAVRVCAALGFDYIWIDSLCILQDSIADWQEQSAVMADVYKFAWLNIAALSTASDFEGFINDARDPRVIWGFKTALAPILGTGPPPTWDHRGRLCALLSGEAMLLWDIQRDLPGGGDWLAPLFTRAWVYQERRLARRILAFATHGVFFACDEAHHGENPTGLDGVVSGAGPRQLLHSMADHAAALAEETLASGTVPSPAQLQKEAINLLNRFGSTWNRAVVDYTQCKLTKDSDRLIAISSVARELANSGVPQQQRYLAGLWDINLIFQLGWMTCEGRTVLSPRKRVGTKDYVAPSWSWASVEAPVASCGEFLPEESERKALADVRNSDVVIATDFAFGAVRAGWVRLWGCPRAVSASKTNPNHDYEGSSVSTSLTDAATGEKSWFASDNAEGYHIVSSWAGLSNVVWVPHILSVNSSMVGCDALVLEEVSPSEGFVGGSFVRPGEKIYRRLGTGNFGRIPNLFRQDKLVMSLGTFPETDDMAHLLAGFRRNNAGYQEFVII